MDVLLSIILNPATVFSQYTAMLMMQFPSRLIPCAFGNTHILSISIRDMYGCRELRLKELQAKSSTQVKGIVQKITREQFVSEVTETSRHKNVIVHLYKDK